MIIMFCDLTQTNKKHIIIHPEIIKWPLSNSQKWLPRLFLITANIHMYRMGQWAMGMAIFGNNLETDKCNKCENTL